MLNKNWSTKKLGEVCDINMGQSPSSSTYNQNKNGLPFYQGKKDYGEINPSPNVWCSGPVKIVENGDILISVRAPVGALNIAQEKSCIGRGLAGLRAGENLDQAYLFYFLKAREKNIAALGTGSTFTAISKKHLENLEIPLPPLSQQKKIVARLEKQLAKIKEAKRLRAEALELTQSLLSAELHKIFEEGKRKGWEEKELGNLFEITSSKRVFKSEWKTSGVPFYRAREIVRLVKNKPFKDPIFISEEMYDEYKERYGVPKEGDILATGVGTLGICYRVKKNDRFYFKDGNIIWLKNTSGVDSKFIEYFFKSDLLKDQIDLHAGGATVRTFTIQTAKRVKIYLPSFSEQKMIVARLDVLQEKIQKLQEHQKSTQFDLNRLEQSILHKAFN